MPPGYCLPSSLCIAALQCRQGEQHCSRESLPSACCWCFLLPRINEHLFIPFGQTGNLQFCKERETFRPNPASCGVETGREGEQRASISRQILRHHHFPFRLPLPSREPDLCRPQELRGSVLSAISAAPARAAPRSGTKPGFRQGLGQAPSRASCARLQLLPVRHFWGS